MINYSEFGTEVDKVKYSCDYSIKRTYSTKKIKDYDSSVVATVKNIIKKSRREKIENSKLELNDDEDEKVDKNKDINNSKKEEDNELIEQVYLRDDNRKLCYCDRKSDQKSNSCGWEGSAILNHGSLINFGCLEFTFSVTSFGIDYSNISSSDDQFD